MKTTIIAAFMLLTAQAFAQLPTEGLRAYYPFSGNTEDEAMYNDGIGLDITLTEDRFGGADCAYEFAGEMTSMILIQGMPHFNITPDSSCTISLWFNGGSDDPGDWESLFIKYGDVFEEPIFDPAYGLLLYDLNKPLMTSTSSQLWMQDNVNPFPSDDQWHHLVGVFKTGEWSIYFDNLLEGTYSDPAAVVGEFASDVAIGTNFEGKIDDIAFYGRDLSVQEIDQLYNMPSSCAATSISSEAEAVFSLYPNPASVNVVLEIDQISTVRILDSRGRAVTEISAALGRLDLDVSDWEPGHYLVQIVSENGSQSRSLVVE